jgi:hypothetical protein
MDTLSIRSGLCFQRMYKVEGAFPQLVDQGPCGRLKAHLLHQPHMLTTTGKTEGHEFIGWDQILRKALEV